MNCLARHPHSRPFYGTGKCVAGEEIPPSWQVATPLKKMEVADALDVVDTIDEDLMEETPPPTPIHL
jgi:hypothetical protein